MIRRAFLSIACALVACSDAAALLNDAAPPSDVSPSDASPSDASPLDVSPLDVSPTRSCRTTFTFALGRPARTVAVAGEWNGFSSTASPMRAEGTAGVYRAELELAPGDYGYKFVVDGSEWHFDPNTVERKYVGREENSRIRVEDCALPSLRVARLATTADGTLELDVAYTDGAEGRGLDPASVRVTMLPTALPQGAVTTEQSTGTIRVRAQGLARTKYSLRIHAATASGRAARELFVPVWIEQEPYQWGDGPLYFVFTDRFRNGDPTNDGRAGATAPIADWNGGDFAGVTAAIREGYFDRLGVRALWLSPVNANTAAVGRGSDGRNYAGYHGYWVRSARETDSHWGSLDELRALNAEAHRHGIRVLYDLVHNQLHREHPYFIEHQRDGWFNGDGSCVCGGPACDWDERVLDCWFTNYLPDVNWASMAAADTMLGDAWWWLTETDADGFRVDAVKHMNFLSTTNLRAMLDRWETGNARAYSVGETFTGGDGHELVGRYVGRNALHAQFDFPLYWAIRRAFAANEGSMGDLEGAVQASERAYGDAPMSPFLGNHDVTRFLSEAAGQLSGDSREQGFNNPPAPPSSDEPYERMALAWTFTLTQRGVPLIYYGDEIGLPGAGDPDNRRMMRFHDDLNPRERRLLEHVQRIGTLRSTHPGLRRGPRRALHTDGDGYVYARGVGADAALIALNRGSTERTISVRVDTVDLPDGTVLRDALGGPSVTVRDGAIAVPFRPRSSALYLR